MSEAAKLLDELRRDHHVHEATARLTPMSGGVSSEIYLVEDGAAKFVVKRALARLKVKEDWRADVSRNTTEWRYLELVARMMPGTVPKLFFTNEQAGYFGMEFLGADYANWKEILLAGDCRQEHARLAGEILGEIHHRTSGDDFPRDRFDTTVNFRQLRLEPYLGATARRHPELSQLIESETQRIEATREALVHGDFSPKNILFRDRRMVLLDCEVAWYGDPAFDVAFLLNHLFLKALLHAPRELGFEGMIAGFWQQYLASSRREASEFEPRVARLLPLLLLARVDGKSPVEYLDSARQEFIRHFVYEQLQQEQKRLEPFTQAWLGRLRSLIPTTI